MIKKSFNLESLNDLSGIDRNTSSQVNEMIRLIKEFEKLTELSLYDFLELYKAGFIPSFRSYSNALKEVDGLTVHKLIALMKCK